MNDTIDGDNFCLAARPLNTDARLRVNVPKQRAKVINSPAHKFERSPHMNIAHKFCITVSRNKGAYFGHHLSQSTTINRYNLVSITQARIARIFNHRAAIYHAPNHGQVNWRYIPIFSNGLREFGLSVIAANVRQYVL